jgi:hypothetical protein
MNRNEKDFENIVSRLNIDDSPDDAHRRNLRRRMLSVFNETSSRRTITFQTIAGTIIKSRLAKLAAAAVIIIAIGLFLIGRNPEEQTKNRTKIQVAKSPAEMLTAVSLNIAYRKGGIEAVEKQCEEAFNTMGYRPRKVSIQELMVEFNGV